METGQFDLVPLNIFFYIFDMLFLTYSPNRKMIYQNYCNLFKVKPYFAWAMTKLIKNDLIDILRDLK